MKLSAALAGALLAVTAHADWLFGSRPDLSPPRLNITIPASKDVESGFLFLAPFAGLADGPGEMHGPRQAAPYIFRDDGVLAAKWYGKDILFSFEGDHNAGYGHGHGHTTIMDQHYETIRELRAGRHKLTDKHEFHVVSEDTALIRIYQPTPVDLSPWGPEPAQQWIVDAVFQESVLPITTGQAGSGYNSSDAWDYFHINSIDKDPQGAYLISARNACSVHKINGTTGEIIWRLAGKRSDFALGPNVDFCFQHHARFLSRNEIHELISLYDNSAHGTEDGRGREVRTAPTSSGKTIALDTTTWTATLVQAFYPPGDLLSKSQGSMQVLPNGNALVNWGSSGAVTEFSPVGTPLFHAYMDSDLLGVGVQNYRGFRFNWTGVPREEPVVVALRGRAETRVWRFWGADERRVAGRRLLGEVKRRGFETVITLPGRDYNAVSAEAVDRHGRVLTSTEAVVARKEVLPYTGGLSPGRANGLGKQDATVAVGDGLYVQV